jgi:hypothetical protein
MGLDDGLTITCSYAAMFNSCNLIDWKSVTLASAGLFVVFRVLKYYNATRVSEILFVLTTDMKIVID